MPHPPAPQAVGRGLSCPGGARGGGGACPAPAAGVAQAGQGVQECWRAGALPGALPPAQVFSPTSSSSSRGRYGPCLSCHWVRVTVEIGDRGLVRPVLGSMEAGRQAHQQNRAPRYLRVPVLSCVLTAEVPDSRNPVARPWGGGTPRTAVAGKSAWEAAGAAPLASLALPRGCPRVRGGDSSPSHPCPPDVWLGRNAVAPPGPDSAQGPAQTSGPHRGRPRAVPAFAGTLAQRGWRSGPRALLPFLLHTGHPRDLAASPGPWGSGGRARPQTRRLRLATHHQRLRQEGPSQASRDTLPGGTSGWTQPPHTRSKHRTTPTRAPPTQSQLLGQAWAGLPGRTLGRCCRLSPTEGCVWWPWLGGCGAGPGGPPWGP